MMHVKILNIVNMMFNRHIMRRNTNEGALSICGHVVMGAGGILEGARCILIEFIILMLAR